MPSTNQAGGFPRELVYQSRSGQGYTDQAQRTPYSESRMFPFFKILEGHTQSNPDDLLYILGSAKPALQK